MKERDLQLMEKYQERGFNHFGEQKEIIYDQQRGMVFFNDIKDADAKAGSAPAMTTERANKPVMKLIDGDSQQTIS